MRQQCQDQMKPKTKTAKRTIINLKEPMKREKKKETKIEGTNGGEMARWQKYTELHQLGFTCKWMKPFNLRYTLSDWEKQKQYFTLWF